MIVPHRAARTEATWWCAWTLQSTFTSPRQMMVPPAPTRSYQASVIVWSARRAVPSGPKPPPRVTVFVPGASPTRGPSRLVRRFVQARPGGDISARVCRSSTIGWTGGASACSSFSTYSALSRSAAASGTLMCLFLRSGSRRIPGSGFCWRKRGSVPPECRVSTAAAGSGSAVRADGVKCRRRRCRRAPGLPGMSPAVQKRQLPLYQ